MNAEKLATLHALASASPWSQKSFEQQLAQDGTIFVAQDHAFALGRALFDEAELLQIATHPEHQRLGLGKQMLAQFEQRAKELGSARAFLEVARSNGAARALYSNAGWIEDGARKGYYRRSDGTREDAILMSKNL